ncbi:HNH endonuclease [Anatilimnocola floriformis]|uniref:HNH endonuclease n=1 Tax=Anatilimnocola floriformis TaxID=2948575 RepID=UPI0020C1F8AD|nr:HNH endonuclease [Anatilimnocola floriformis]
MKIELSKDAFSEIDDEFAEAVNQYKWSLHSKGYAYRQADIDGERRTILLHRYVMELAGREPGFRTDHINKDRLDNRLENLRAATASQNAVNSKLRANNKSGFRGVCWESGKWLAKIKVNYVPIRLGRFDDKIAAARAYDAAARAVWPDFAVLNFPESETLGMAA